MRRGWVSRPQGSGLVESLLWDGAMTEASLVAASHVNPPALCVRSFSGSRLGLGSKRLLPVVEGQDVNDLGTDLCSCGVWDLSCAWVGNVALEEVVVVVDLGLCLVQWALYICGGGQKWQGQDGGGREAHLVCVCMKDRWRG